MPQFPRILSAVAALPACFAACWALRMAYADYLGGGERPRDPVRAAAVAPANARYWLRLAEQRRQAGEDSGGALERAAAASPHDAAVWIRVGLQAERDGDHRAAERHLLRAARLSRLYEPRWTLANYYFRSGNEAEFWRWTRSALDWTYDDRRPLFRLAWAMTGDAAAILERACSDNPRVLSEYLDFLLSTRRLDAAEGCAARLAGVADAETRRLLIGFVSVMIDAGRREAALAAWNALCSRGLLPYRPLDPAGGRSLSNGGFEEKPLETGFDWRMSQTPGVSVISSRNPAMARISFSGRHPEDCAVLTQLAPVLPGRRYDLRFECRVEGMAPESGLGWAVLDGASGRELPALSPPLSGDAWRAGRVAFTTPPETRWIRLTLRYRRPLGTARAAGELWVRAVSLGEERR